MTYLSIDRVEVPIGLIAQLSYYQECKNFNEENKHPYKYRILNLAARKTISEMLTNDVQVSLLIHVLSYFPFTFKIIIKYS